MNFLRWNIYFTDKAFEIFGGISQESYDADSQSAYEYGYEAGFNDGIENHSEED